MSNGDNWGGRSTGMICGTCIFFVAKACGIMKDDELMERGPIGRCRRRCPTMNGFPVIFATDWCGDHRIDENKI